MKTHFCAALAALSILTWSPASAQGDDAAQVQFKTYETLLEYARSGQTERFSEASEFLKGSAARFKLRYGRDLEGELRKALQAKSSDRVQRQVLAFVVYEIKDIVARLQEKKTLSRRQIMDNVLMLFKYYKLLAPAVKQSDPSKDEEIKSKFEEIVQLLKANDSPFVDSRASSFNMAKQLRAIENLCERYAAE